MAPCDTSKDGSNTNPAGAAAPPPCPKEDIFDTLRRFSDMNISTLLHSLIGLPSVLHPPNPSAWVMDDESAAAGRSAGAGVVTEEVRKLNANPTTAPTSTSNNSSDDDGDMATTTTSSTSSASTTAGGENAPNARIIQEHMYLRPTHDPVFPASLLAASAAAAMLPAIRFMESIERDLNTFSAAAEQQQQHEHTRPRHPAEDYTELGYYEMYERLTNQARAQQQQAAAAAAHQVHLQQAQLQQQEELMQQRMREYARQNIQTYTNSQTSVQGDRGTVVSETMETRSVTGLDGVMRTRHVQVRRFADGSEERVERDDTKYPPQPPSWAQRGPRIVEVEEESSGSDAKAGASGSVVQQVQQLQQRQEQEKETPKGGGKGWFWSSSK